MVVEANLRTGNIGCDTDAVGGPSVGYDGDGSEASIGSVIIRAGAQVSGTARWTGVSVQFWDGPDVEEELCDMPELLADANASGTGSQEQTIVITPNYQHFSRVRVVAGLEFTAQAGTFPDWNDLFGQVFIMPAA
jgi:hypothetical protein